jgi:formate/nitrite transporter FocA (FNT family)
MNRDVWNMFFINNLIPVTIENTIGGAALAAAIHWVAFLPEEKI